MANIKITTSDNKKYNIKGGLTFEAVKLEKEDGEVLDIRGQMSTHYYIEDISKIETHRYLLTGVEVYRETFGSDDFNILYEFKIKDYHVKNGLTNLGNTIIESIEADLYSESLSKLWEGDEN